jgi:Phosphotransferase enzyme family
MDNLTAALPEGSEQLLHKAGLDGPVSVVRLRGGRNNRVFRVGAAERTVVLKHYFHAPSDLRDRLHAEFCFLQVAQAKGLTCVATPLARDDANHLGLYSHLPGRTMTTADVTPAAIEAALGFVIAMNTGSQSSVQDSVPTASEACFSAADHLGIVEKRISRLMAEIGEHTALGRDARAFVAHELVPAWTRVQRSALSALEAEHESFRVERGSHQRILSPSDFGFHNALIHEDSISFLDFEYAGWDGPAKLVGDAFNQVKVPLAMDAYRNFRDRIAQLFSDPEREARRCDAFLGVYAIKWTTILLNDFLPLDGSRRDFALQDESGEARRAQQLVAARHKLCDRYNLFVEGSSA